MTIIPVVIGALGTAIKVIGTGNGRLGDKRTSGDPPNYGIADFGQNTEKSPGGPRRLAVTQTPVKDHQQTMV